VPIAVPAIQLLPIEDRAPLVAALQHLSTYDWVIFTSPNAVEFLWAQAAQDTTAIAWRGTKIAAVGPATRSALQAHGLTIEAMPDHYIGTEITSTLGDIRNQRILLPRSAQGGAELPAALTELGATVDEIALYTPAPATMDDAARNTLAGGVDIVTFASGSAVRAFAKALRNDHRFDDFWSTVLVACIGPTTAEVARSEGLRVHVVASEHSASGLVAALVAYFEQGA
jgi:uroporphyrinogen-III synthase